MKRGLIIAALLLALFPASAVAKCRFACVAHRVTDLKILTLGLEAQQEEDEERLRQQASALEGLRGRVSALEARDTQLASWVFGFQKCLGEVPISRYGEEQGPSGYFFQYLGEGSFKTLATTALDITYPRDPVGAWIYVNACNRERVTAKASLIKK